MDTTSTTTIAHDRSATNAARPTVRARLGLALLAATLVSAAACGSDSTTPDRLQPDHDRSPTSTPIASTTPRVAPTTTITTGGTPTTAVTTVARPTATIDELVGAEGERVHVRCVGHGDTTVVLIAGFGGDTTGWANVEPAIAGRARVCSYDRPGTETSDPAIATATFTTEATDLHDLLRAIGEPGPYVVVGQSFGGAQAVTFAALYPDEVSGLDARRRLPHHVARRPLLRTRRRLRGRRHRDGRLRRVPPDGRRRDLDVVAAFAEVSNVVSSDRADGCDHSRRSRTAPRTSGVRGGTPHRGLEPGSAGHGRRFRTAAHVVTVTTPATTSRSTNRLS